MAAVRTVVVVEHRMAAREVRHTRPGARHNPPVVRHTETGHRRVATGEDVRTERTVVEEAQVNRTAVEVGNARLVEDNTEAVASVGTGPEEAPVGSSPDLAVLSEVSLQIHCSRDGGRNYLRPYGGGYDIVAVITLGPRNLGLEG